MKTFTRNKKQYQKDNMIFLDKFDFVETAITLGLLTAITLLSVYATGGVL